VKKGLEEENCVDLLWLKEGSKFYNRQRHSAHQCLNVSSISKTASHPGECNTKVKMSDSAVVLGCVQHIKTDETNTNGLFA
jgi:hypothetical protein